MQQDNDKALGDPSSLSQLFADLNNFDAANKAADEVELSVSYLEYERLFNAGLITSEQRRRGQVPRADLPAIQVINSRFLMAVISNYWCVTC